MLIKVRDILKKYKYILLFLFLFIALNWKIFVKGYIVGPFDLLMGFYAPYIDIPRQSQELFDAAYHYKNELLSDVLTIMIPSKLTAVNMIKDSVLPVWNPYILTGQPLLASVFASVFYPLTALYFIFPPSAAYNIYILLQPILAFVFMFAFLKKAHKISDFACYVGSISFALGAYMTVWLTWGSYGHGFLWLPLVILSFSKLSESLRSRYTLFAILGLVFSFFAGHTQTAMMVWLAGLLYILFRFFQKPDVKFLKNSLIIFFISFLLITPQLIETTVLHSQSVRDMVASESFYKDQTLRFSSYLQLFAPDFFGNPVTRNWWGKINYAESAIYFGTVSLAFFIYSLLTFLKQKRRKYFFLIFLIFLGFALSVANPLSYLIFKLNLPLFSSSTFARYSAIFIFAASVLSAIGAQQFLDDLGSRSFIKIRNFLILILFLLAIYWFFILSRILLPQNYLENISVIIRNSLIPTVILGLLIAFFTFCIFILKKTVIKISSKAQIKCIKVAVVLLLSFELMRFFYKFTPYSPASFFYPSHPVVDKIKELTDLGQGRYRYTLPPNINSMYEASSIEGSDPLYNKRLAELSAMGEGKVEITDRAAMQFKPGPYQERILDLFSMKYFIDRKDSDRNDWVAGHEGGHDGFNSRFKFLWTDETYTIYENTKALDRVKLFYRSEFISGQQARLKRLIQPSFNYHQTVVVEDKDYLMNKTGKGTIKIISQEPNKQHYKINTDSEALLYVGDVYYPGWQAYIDNIKTPITQANHAFRAVKIPAGRHDVVFQYNYIFLKAAIVLFTIGCALMFAIYRYDPK